MQNKALNYELGCYNIITSSVIAKFGIANRSLSLTNSTDMFANLHHSWGLCDSHCSTLSRRSCVMDIIIGKTTYVCLSTGTVAVVCDRRSHNFVRFLHPTCTDSIRSVTYNSSTSCYTVVYVDTTSEMSTLKAASFQECLLHFPGENIFTPLFGNDFMKSPGFVELDSSTTLALTFCPHRNETSLGNGTKGIYRVYDITCHTLINSFCETSELREARISRGTLIKIYHVLCDNGRKFLPIRLTDVINMSYDVKLNIEIASGLPITLLDCCNGYFFIKQAGRSFYVFNLTVTTQNGNVECRKFNLPKCFPSDKDQTFNYDFCPYRSVFSVTCVTKACVIDFHGNVVSEVFKIKKGNCNPILFAPKENCIFYFGEPDIYSDDYNVLGATASIRLRELGGRGFESLIGHLDLYTVTNWCYDSETRTVFMGDVRGIVCVYNTI